jgi:hypothetical protein
MSGWWLACASAAVFVLLPAGPANATDDQSDSVMIPLDQIWAYEMPGTRDVWELEPDKFGPKLLDLRPEERRKRFDESLTHQTVRHLGVTKLGVQAAPGFAVLGTGKEVLREAHAVLAGGRTPRRTFPPNSKVALVFFSKVFDYYVHLDKVEQQGNRIMIKYFFVPHRGNGTSHFALIPLGQLPAGEWQVDVARSPWPKSAKFSVYPEPGAEWNSVVVCRPFDFVVEPPTTK